MSSRFRLKTGSPYEVARPAWRELRVFSVDPALAGKLQTVDVSETLVRIPWEQDPDHKEKDGPAPGPRGEYLEVIDIDPSSGCYYAPVDLNQNYLLAQNGLNASDGNPQFHQQMVYAVAMRTIRIFEEALGRRSLWSPRRHNETEPRREEFVRQLRIYPHALREANAYYSPRKKALLFGYFPAMPEDVMDHMPNGMVFTCLSHDIIVHETTHALLDGMHRRFLEPTNPDVLAFHEAFADIVALFQHFSLPEVLEHQIITSEGRIREAKLLGELAQQFGVAIGRGRALRSAITLEPDPDALNQVFQPHDRGAILVAAVFDAFLAIYENRTADLMRIANIGTNNVPGGKIHPDLVKRLAAEAVKASKHVLTMCIRALDYVPPVDITFGEYLRALITADADLYVSDERNYRVAFIEAFRRRGIYPDYVKSFSEEGLRWETMVQSLGVADPAVGLGKGLKDALGDWSLEGDRREIFDNMRAARAQAHEIIKRSSEYKAEFFLGIDLFNGKFEVHSIRPVRRTGEEGQFLMDMVVELTQKRPGYIDAPMQALGHTDEHGPDFWYRGGCTLIVDMETNTLRYCIYKDINSQTRYQRTQEFLKGEFLAFDDESQNSDQALRGTYLSSGSFEGSNEILAMVHHSCSAGGER